MKKFTAPEIEVANFNLSDVLTTSGNDTPVVTDNISNAGVYDGILAADNGVTYVD